MSIAPVPRGDTPDSKPHAKERSKKANAPAKVLEHRAARFAGRFQDRVISTKAAAHTCTTGSMIAADRSSTVFWSMPVGFNHPSFDHPQVQRDLLRARK
jgi:hypothetical protein